MLDNVIHEYGGLHGRLTSQMHVRPFTLNECERYYRKRQFHLSRYEMVLSYMAFGGIPYYLDLLRRERTLTENLDEFFFHKTKAKQEFEDVYVGLFNSKDNYVGIVRVRHIENASNVQKGWKALQRSPRFFAWSGVTFELVAMMHQRRLADALRVGTISACYCWRGKSPAGTGAQIDLVMEWKGEQRTSRCGEQSRIHRLDYAEPREQREQCPSLLEHCRVAFEEDDSQCSLSSMFYVSMLCRSHGEIGKEFGY